MAEMRPGVACARDSSVDAQRARLRDWGKDNAFLWFILEGVKVFQKFGVSVRALLPLTFDHSCQAGHGLFTPASGSKAQRLQNIEIYQSFGGHLIPMLGHGAKVNPL